MSFRIVFVFEGETVVYQDEPAGRVARVFGTQRVLSMSPALQAAIDAEMDRLVAKGDGPEEKIQIGPTDV